MRVCSDAYGQRLPDRSCGSSSRSGGGSRWLYYNGGTVPAVGGSTTEGSTSPRMGVNYGLAPNSGVSRGGFGGIGEGFGGGHGFGE